MSAWEPCIGASDEWRLVRTMLNYDPETGVFTWNCDVSNVKAGSRTGSKTKKGYLLIRLNKKQYLAHRLAWFWMTGIWPAGLIDHKNTDKTDNRWGNLRQASNSDNLLNRGRNSNNSSGFKGVSFDKSAGKFAAYLTVKGQRKHLGYYETPEAAHAAYAGAIRDASPEFARF